MRSLLLILSLLACANASEHNKADFQAGLMIGLDLGMVDGAMILPHLPEDINPIIKTALVNSLEEKALQLLSMAKALEADDEARKLYFSTSLQMGITGLDLYLLVRAEQKTRHTDPEVAQRLDALIEEHTGNDNIWKVEPHRLRPESP